MSHVLIFAVLSVLLHCRPAQPDLPLHIAQAQRLRTLSNGATLVPYRPEVPAGFPEYPRDERSRLTRQGIELGRWLFFDRQLSVENSVSCASCHRPELSFADDKPLSIGIRNQRTLRNSMPLVNLAWDQRFFWDGRSKALEEAVLMPVANDREMGMMPELLAEKLARSPFYRQFFSLVYGSAEISPSRIGNALAQFLRSLISRESAIDQIRMVQLGHRPVTSLEPQWRTLASNRLSPEVNVIQNACAGCHESARFGANRFENVGLPGDADIETPLKVKVPSLYNISYTAPYMHDGSLGTETSVLDHYDRKIRWNASLAPELTTMGKGRQFRFTAEQRRAAVQFLQLFNDKKFVQNTLHYDPFVAGADLGG